MSHVSSRPFVSIVAPVHNEEANIPALVAAIERAFDDIHYEVLLIDDGSTDRSWACILRAGEDVRVRGLRFGRNFGHQAAIAAGLREARGDAVITMDADLQDPPDVARQMVAKWQDGHDLVEARRTTRPGETWAKRASAYVFYRLVRATAAQPLPVDVGDFRLLSRRAVDAINSVPEKEWYLRGLVAWFGLSRSEVTYDRPARVAGKTSFSLSRMLGFATTGVLSCTVLPLRAAAAGAGGFLAVGLASIILGLAGGRSVGEASIWTLAGGIAIQCGVTLVVGVLCIAYLARITAEVRGRPMYWVADRTYESSVRTGTLPSFDRSYPAISAMTVQLPDEQAISDWRPRPSG